MTPGLDTALVLRTVAVEGHRRAFAAAGGICTGVIIWGVVMAFGLGALLAASRQAYDILRWAGAAYLFYLGIGMLLRPRRSFDVSVARSSGVQGHGGWYLRGMLTNLLNPKVGVFYVSFLPQFIPQDQSVRIFSVLLASIHSIEGILWFSLLIVATRPIIGALRRPAMIQALDRITGFVLIACGMRLAVEARS
jgi:threonine/homoserine/homoserine lactone efflux protein